MINEERKKKVYRLVEISPQRQLSVHYKTVIHYKLVLYVNQALSTLQGDHIAGSGPCVCHMFVLAAIFWA